MANMNTRIEELRNDYKKVEDWDTTNAEKKELADKYNSPSKKTKDIQTQILFILRDIRQNRVDFDKDDIKDFNNLNTGTSLYNKLAEALQKEPKEFAQFYFKSVEDTLNEMGWDKYITWSSAQIKNYVRRDRFRIESLVKDYNNLKKYLYSLTDEKKSQDQFLKELNEKFQKEMEGFKEEYLKDVEESATFFFEHIDETIERSLKLSKEYEEKVEQRKVDLKAEGYKGFSYYNDYEYQELEKSRKYFRDRWANCKYIKRTHILESYVNEQVEEATKIFNRNVEALCKRVIEKGLIIEKIQITGIGRDPKFFKMFIEDGNQKLYARSIYAAEDSDKMITHFRFIITNRKPKEWND